MSKITTFKAISNEGFKKTIIEKKYLEEEKPEDILRSLRDHFFLNNETLNNIIKNNFYFEFNNIVGTQQRAGRENEYDYMIRSRNVSDTDNERFSNSGPRAADDFTHAKEDNKYKKLLLILNSHYVNWQMVEIMYVTNELIVYNKQTNETLGKTFSLDNLDEIENFLK